MDIDFGSPVKGKLNTEFEMAETNKDGLDQFIRIGVWTPDVDSREERKRHAKVEALAMLRRAVATLEQDLGE